MTSHTKQNSSWAEDSVGDVYGIRDIHSEALTATQNDWNSQYGMMSQSVSAPFSSMGDQQLHQHHLTTSYGEQPTQGSPSGPKYRTVHVLPIPSTKASKRSSTVLLESKLPAFMRANLPKFDETQESNAGVHLPPPPASMDGTPGAHASSSYAQHFSQWWHTHSRHRHDEMVKRLLERRLLLKNIVVTALSEFVGTFLFLFFALAINTTCSIVKENARTDGATGTDLVALLVSSLGFGFSLVISAWVFFRVSGGVQNPAITLALMLTGALNVVQFVVLTIVQFLGGIAAAGLINGLYPSSVDSRTTLAPSTTVNQGFWLEFFMSAQLIFTVLMLAAEKHKATFLAPVGIGLALFITQLLGQPYTGASVNPARTLGPDVIQNEFSSYCWIYYLSSYAAAIVTSMFYISLKWIRYETATPDQDADEQRARLTRQVISDAHGNLIGVMDTVSAEEYNAKHVHGHDESDTNEWTKSDLKHFGGSATLFKQQVPSPMGTLTTDLDMEMQKSPAPPPPPPVPAMPSLMAMAGVPMQRQSSQARSLFTAPRPTQGVPVPLKIARQQSFIVPSQPETTLPASTAPSTPHRSSISHSPPTSDSTAFPLQFPPQSQVARFYPASAAIPTANAQVDSLASACHK